MHFQEKFSTHRHSLRANNVFTAVTKTSLSADEKINYIKHAGSCRLFSYPAQQTVFMASTVLVGYALLVASAVFFIASLYAVVFSKVLPSTSSPVFRPTLIFNSASF